MPAILNLILALFGVGAIAGAAGGGGGGSTPAEPSSSRKPESDRDDEVDTPLGAEVEAVTSDAPDLPASAYALGWDGLTAQEQYMLELVNRARLDPEAEAVRTGDAVDSGVSTAPKQALAVDPILSAAADNHSADMLARNFFAHKNPDGDGPTARARDEDWDGGVVWENISARWTGASSVSDKQGWVDASHEGLWESDGHQFGMLQPGHTVVGIGIDWGEWTYDGDTHPTAMLVTEKFANDGQTYLTGVGFDDADNDVFYDIGEGQGGVGVTVWNDDTVHATSTWDAGGYSLALEDGTYNVRFEGGDLSGVFETSVTISGRNEKLDLNEDDLRVSALAMAAGEPSLDEEDPIADLFLSADASLERIEHEANLVERLIEQDEDTLLAMV